MEVAKIFVGSTSGIARNRKRIPAGKTVSGLTVSVEFTDPVWEDMTKTVVFRGTDSRIAEFDGKTAVIPWEVLTEPGVRIWFGIFGHNPETGMQLPLIEVEIGATERATDPLADPGTEPTLPIWAQLQEEIEKLKQAGVSEEKIAQIVADYLTKNPPTVSEKDPTVPDWAKNKEKPEYTAQEVGALSQDALDGAVNDALAKAKESGEFDGKDGAPGQNYVLTDADKADIAEMAADLVDVPEHSGGNAGFVVQDTEPEDTSVLWVDPTDNSEDGFQEAVNAALAQAKESGEFDGPPGQPGKDGKDGVVAVTGATVGQTVKISAVDENGVPTAWEPTDFPEGGGGSGDGSGWKKVVEYVWDGNKEYQPLSLDYATGEMTFDAVPPTNKAMWPALNFDGITKVTDLVSLYTKIPNEFMAADPTSTMASGANGYTYGGKTTLAQGGANANVDVSAFHFEVSNTVPTFSGLNAKKVKIRIIAPGGNEWLSNSSFNFQVKLSNGTTCNSYSPSDGSRVILNLIEQTVSIDGDVYSSLFELTADRFQSRSNANQSVKYLYQRRITDRRIVPNGVTITEVSYPSGNGNYRPCNGTVVEVYVYED